MSKLAQIFARGIAAIEADDFEGLQAAAADANKPASDDPRARYLHFMSIWLDESAEEEQLDELFAEASEIIEAASKHEDVSAAGRIVLDLADVLLDSEEVDEAEHAVRELLERGDLDERTAAEARLLQAQILMDFHEDVEEALVQLDGVAPAMRERPGYVSLRAAVLLELGRDDDAVGLLREAIGREDDTELRYQLGMILRQLGRADEALEHMLAVRKRDLERNEVDPNEPVPSDEAADLGRYLEDVLDSLPEPVMERVASAAIRVERWVSEAAVRNGADPRSGLAFEGTPARDDDDGKVDSMVIYRDAIVAQIDADEEIPSLLAMNLVEEVDRFFDLELFPGD
jgi:tetratricopeptide (TPR) repeat protein